MNQRDFLYKSSRIIDRMGSNHFRWYITLISITGLSIPINSLIINVNDFIIRCIISVFLTLIIGCLSGIAFCNSKKYLEMERCYIKSENEWMKTFVRNNLDFIDKNIEELFNWENYKDDLKTKKKGFVFYSSIILLFVNMNLPLIILVVSYYT